MGGISVLTLLIPVAAKAGGAQGYPYLLVIGQTLIAQIAVNHSSIITNHSIKKQANPSETKHSTL